MKMEVLAVQNQFQGQFGMMGSTKVRGKFNEIYIIVNNNWSKIVVIVL